MKSVVVLSDISPENRNTSYICNEYGVSRISAWRLLSGRASHICPGYHNATINIADNAWSIITSPVVAGHIRNCIAYQLKVWRKEKQIGNYIDDIANECYIRAYQKSGIWVDMPEQKKNAYLATLAKRTTNDFMKKQVHYTDKHKNNMYLMDTYKTI